ncbi:endogenous retrovirus group K member 10 Pro protein-like [Dipodomys merriami]|uniref:endogenous retrovirus group K member 10 Pro protein-like n=1 Tax=Dipodomys merriami TaxID=94247 RepID=UPI0038559D93
MKLKINGTLFKGIIDTGADCIVLRKEEIEGLGWNLIPGPCIQGVGGKTNLLQAQLPARWEECDGATRAFKPLVAPGLPCNLWGRDVLTNMGTVITTDDRLFMKTL